MKHFNKLKFDRNKKKLIFLIQKIRHDEIHIITNLQSISKTIALVFSNYI